MVHSARRQLSYWLISIACVAAKSLITRLPHSSVIQATLLIQTLLSLSMMLILHSGLAGLNARERTVRRYVRHLYYLAVTSLALGPCARAIAVWLHGNSAMVNNAEEKIVLYGGWETTLRSLDVKAMDMLLVWCMIYNLEGVRNPYLLSGDFITPRQIALYPLRTFRSFYTAFNLTTLFMNPVMCYKFYQALFNDDAAERFLDGKLRIIFFSGTEVYASKVWLWGLLLLLGFPFQMAGLTLGRWMDETTYGKIDDGNAGECCKRCGGRTIVVAKKKTQ